MELTRINEQLKGTLFIKGILLQIPKVKCNITGISSIDDITDNSIVYAKKEKYLKKAINSNAAAILIPDTLEAPNKKIIIQCKDHKKAFNKLLALFKEEIYIERQIHKNAIIGNNTSLGKNIAIMANTVIEDNVYIGDNTIIYPNCYIGNDTRIGANSIIYPGVAIHSKCTIGDSVIIKSNAVIGADGFGYHLEKNEHIKIPQIGTVEIQSNVEIGSGVCVDKATVGKTLIGKGTKIDNLVQIAHNCKIGENCIIAGQTGLAGSVSLENNVTLAGQVGIVDHCHIGNSSVVMARSMVNHSLPPKSIVFGYPARPIKEAKRIYKAILKLCKQNSK